MCRSIIIDDIECETRAELEAALELGPAICEAQCPGWLPHQCLCPCDPEAIADAVGRSVVYEDGGDMVFVRKNANE